MGDSWFEAAQFIACAVFFPVQSIHLFCDSLLLDEEGGSGDQAVVLTDILGIEDALGTMDFKVAGNEKGACCTVCCGMVWCGMAWYGMVWYGMVWYGTVWYGMVWFGMIRRTARYGTVRYGADL